VVRPRSCRVIYYFDTPALGRRHQSFGRVSVSEWSSQGKREKGKDDLKSSSSFALHVQGKKENNAVQNGTILGFFFLKKRK
jgi:hypothetical protein